MTDVYSFNAPDSHLYMAGRNEDFTLLKSYLASDLLLTKPFNAGKWQQLDVSGSSAHDTYELQNVTLWIPSDGDDNLEDSIQPDLPWARDHFYERVQGTPVNPGVEYQNWPYHKNGLGLHLRSTDGTEGIYDHNYMERYWPKWAGAGWRVDTPSTPLGYRFPIGDLMDVVDLLVDEPGTRQAYLPVWFPEDTGAVNKQRVPCTLGYHFMIRDDRLHCTYYLRSCEIYRHFTNDVYLTMMLQDWVRQQVNRRTVDGAILNPGQLTMHIASFHGFVGDTDKIKEMVVHV